MSDEFTESFFNWADANSITRHDLAEATGNSIQTISKWRSIGIPKGKQPICRMLMEQHLHQAVVPQPGIRLQFAVVPQPGIRLQFELNRQQFTRWNQAALNAGKTIEDWAFDGLEQMAIDHFYEAAAEDTQKKSNDEDKPA